MKPTPNARLVICMAQVNALVLLGVGCGSDGSRAELPQGAEAVDLDPADFSADIDSEYWPMQPGSTWVYRETDGEGGVFKIVVTVTGRTKTIAGIEARIVHDRATIWCDEAAKLDRLDCGEPVEDTFDWYAQDGDGNLWYLGEDTKEFENGKVSSTEGSWEAGVDGAQAGIALPARPEVGLKYRQEYYEGEAEDRGEVLSLGEHVEVPYGAFDNVLETKDTTPLEPNLVEHKYYAKDVGPVSAITVSGGSDREVLERYTHP